MFRPGSRVRLSAYGRRVFSIASKGMAETGRVVEEREQEHSGGLKVRGVLVIRDGEAEARTYNEEFWEPVA